ncbi:MAG: von Willebrand factor type domain, partial [Pseudomonadota bacterium]
MSLWPLLDPARAAALFVACAALIVLWFLLRPKARRVVVSSLALFELDAKTHRDPRWRERLALLLQLLAAGLLCGALVRESAPEAAPVAAEGATVAYVVDLSASMRAEGRLDAVRALLAANPKNAILSAGESPRLLAPPGLTPSRHAAVVAALQPGWGGADLVAAVRLAESYGYTPIVLSDGPAPDGVAGRIVGEGGPDAAVVNVSASAGVGLPPEVNVAVIVQSQGPERQARLSLETDEGPLGEETVTLPADGVLRRVYRAPPSSSAWVRAVVTAEGDTLPENDASAAALPPLRPAVVWLVTPGNRYLLGALKLLPGLTLKVFTPASAPSPGADVDLVIYDRAAPKAALNPDVVAVYIDPPNGRGPMPLGERVEDPT